MILKRSIYTSDANIFSTVYHTEASTTCLVSIYDMKVPEWSFSIKNVTFHEGKMTVKMASLLKVEFSWKAKKKPLSLL